MVALRLLCDCLLCGCLVAHSSSSAEHLASKGAARSRAAIAQHSTRWRPHCAILPWSGLVWSGTNDCYGLH